MLIKNLFEFAKINMINLHVASRLLLSKSFSTCATWCFDSYIAYSLQHLKFVCAVMFTYDVCANYFFMHVDGKFCVIILHNMQSY